jgi:hypothetical protein
MTTPAEPQTLAQLSSQWLQWVRMVRLVADRSPARHRVDRLEYEQVHRQVRAGCQHFAAEGDEALRPTFQMLLELVKPWLTWESLLHADPIIVQELWLHCQQVERQVWQRRGWDELRRRLVRWGLASLCLVAAVGILWLCWWIGSQGDFDLAQWSWLRRLQRFVGSLSQQARLVALVGVLVLLGMLSITLFRRK